MIFVIVQLRYSSAGDDSSNLIVETLIETTMKSSFISWILDEDDEEEDVWKTMMHTIQSLRLPSASYAIRRTIQRWKSIVNTHWDVILVSRQMQRRYSSEDLFETRTMNYYVQRLETKTMELMYHMTTCEKLEIRYCDWN